MAVSGPPPRAGVSANSPRTVSTNSTQRRTHMRDINQAGLDLIKSFEGILDGDPSTTKLDPYLDPVGIWTIGWGHAIRVGNDFLRGAANRARARALYPGGLTMEQAEALLRADVL